MKKVIYIIAVDVVLGIIVSVFCLCQKMTVYSHFSLSAPSRAINADLAQGDSGEDIREEYS